MESKHNKTKRSKIRWDLCVTIAVFILMSSAHIARQMIQYRCGLALSVSRYSLLDSLLIRLFLFIFLPTLGLIMILVVRLAIINFRFGGKRLLLQVTFVIVAICGIMIPPKFNQIIPGFREGFYENMKANADIVAIQDWLDSSDLDRHKIDRCLPGDYIRLPHDSWPDAIKKLPDLPKQRVRLMKSANNKIYVRVIYGGGIGTVHIWSLVVGVGADEIPLDDYFEVRTEERLELAPNAFVGYARK